MTHMLRLVCWQAFGTEVIRPGFVRVGLHFTMGDDEVEVCAIAIADPLVKLVTFYYYFSSLARAPTP